MVFRMNIKKHKAFEFWKEKMGDTKHNIHCNAVIKSCINMTTNTKMEPEIFIIAGWIHDMGKLIDKKNHHIASLKYLDEFLHKNDKYKIWIKELKDCILNHRKGGNPETIYGLVFKCADKVALYDNNWLEYKKK